MAQHFAPYDPDEDDQSFDQTTYLSESDEDASFESFSMPDSGTDSTESLNKITLDPFEEVKTDSQFTLVGSSQTNIIDSVLLHNQPEIIDNHSEQSYNEHNVIVEAALTDAFEARGESNIEQPIDKPKINTNNQKNLWADNIATILDEYLKEEEKHDMKDHEELVEFTNVIESSNESLEIISEAGSLEEKPLNNTPASEQLNFEEVSQQIFEIGPYFDQSEAFYAEKCVIYWDARGWLNAIQADEYDEEMLISIDRDKRYCNFLEFMSRILLERVKTRLDSQARDRATR